MIHVTTHGLDTAVQKLSNFNGGKLRRALRSAVMRTLKGAKRDAGQKVNRRYTIASGKVTSSIKLKCSGLSGSMTSSGGRNKLPNFILRPKSRPKRPPAGGVYAQVVRGQGGQIQHAFIQRNGQPYERTTPRRFPIKRLTTVSNPGMLSNPHVAPFIVRKMEERIGVNVSHEVAAIGLF